MASNTEAGLVGIEDDNKQTSNKNYTRLHVVKGDGLAG